MLGSIILLLRARGPVVVSVLLFGSPVRESIRLVVSLIDGVRGTAMGSERGGGRLGGGINSMFSLCCGGGGGGILTLLVLKLVLVDMR